MLGEAPSVASSLDHGVGFPSTATSFSARNLSWAMQFHLAACCDASFSAPTREAGIGVSVVLVNHDNVTDERPLLYAWTKQTADRPDLAELIAIRFACVCLDREDVGKRIHAVCSEGAIVKSASISNDCQTVVQTFVGSPDFERVKEIFRERYPFDLSIDWESNKKHSKKSCMALVDEMAIAARKGLELEEEVFAHDAPMSGEIMPRRRARESQPYRFDAVALVSLSSNNRDVSASSPHADLPEFLGPAPEAMAPYDLNALD